MVNELQPKKERANNNHSVFAIIRCVHYLRGLPPGTLRLCESVSLVAIQESKKFFSLIQNCAGSRYNYDMNDKIPCVYLLASEKNGTLYTGVTSNLMKRIYEHKHNLVAGFSKKYAVHLLVYYEIGESMISVIEREKQIKAGTRKNKINLIEKNNPEWKDLYDRLL